MSQKHKKNLTKVGLILDSMLELGSINKVASSLETGVSKVVEISKDFPLWNFYRKKARKPLKADEF